MCGPSGYLCLVDAPSVYSEFTLYDEDMSVYSEITLYDEDMSVYSEFTLYDEDMSVYSEITLFFSSPKRSGRLWSQIIFLSSEQR
jgi:hypothetical protein